MSFDEKYPLDFPDKVGCKITRIDREGGYVTVEFDDGTWLHISAEYGQSLSYIVGTIQ